MLTVILSQLIKLYMFFPLEFIVLDFQALNKSKMGM